MVLVWPKILATISNPTYREVLNFVFTEQPSVKLILSTFYLYIPAIILEEALTPGIPRGASVGIKIKDLCSSSSVFLGKSFPNILRKPCFPA